MERTSSSEGMGTRKGASELKVCQSLAALRTSSWRRIMVIFSPWKGHCMMPDSVRAFWKGSEKADMGEVDCGLRREGCGASVR